MEDVQDTPCSQPSLAPVGSAIPTTVHVEPFHSSVNVQWTPDLTVYSSAVAMQNVDEAQDTPVNDHSDGPDGSEVDCTTHSVPFHRSASVTLTPSLFV